MLAKLAHPYQFYIHDQIQVEKVQKRATPLATTVSDLLCTEFTNHLSSLNLPSLCLTDVKGEMCYFIPVPDDVGTCWYECFLLIYTCYVSIY